MTPFNKFFIVFDIVRLKDFFFDFFVAFGIGNLIIFFVTFCFDKKIIKKEQLYEKLYVQLYGKVIELQKIATKILKSNQRLKKNNLKLKKTIKKYKSDNNL